MRLLLALLAVLGAVVSAAWVVLDHRLTDWVAGEFERAGAAGHLTLRHAELAPPDRVVLRDARLADPVSGRTVASFDELQLLFALTWDDDGPVPRVREVRGHGGRVLLHADDEGLVLVRAIEHLIDIIETLDGPDTAPSRDDPTLPRIVGEDVTIVFGSPGRDSRIVDHGWFSVAGTSDDVRVDVQVGPHGGWVTAGIDDRGLRTIEVSDLALDPTTLDIAHDVGRELADDYAPRGRLDLSLEIDPDTELGRARGQLSDGTLHPEHVPFPLRQVQLPFVWEHGALRVEEASLEYAGGDVVVTLEDGPDLARALISTAEAGFRSELLELIPGRDALTWLHCDDGGHIELFLDVRVDDATDERAVDGWGGFFIESMSLGERNLPLRDVVGRFEVQPGRLSFFSVTARLAQGTIGFRGHFGLEDEHFDLEVWGTELELRDVVPHLDPTGVDETVDVVAGWLDGEVALAGFPGDRDSWTGRGTLSVHGGQLWDVPLFESVLQALSPGGRPSTETDRQRLDVEFTVADSRITVPSGGMRLQSELLSFSGEGYVSRRGGLHLELHALDNAVWKIVQENLLLDIEIDGTLEEPVVKTRPIKMVTGPLGELFDWIPELFGGGEEAEDPPAEGDTGADAH